MERPLYEALQDLRAAKDDLQRASHQMFEGVFARYASLLQSGSRLGDLLDNLLPSVDLEPFYLQATGTIGGMVGTGKLVFPVDKKERVALQRALVLAIARGNPSLNDVTYHFFHTGNSLSGHQQQFVSQVIEPFYRDLVSLVNPYIQEEKATNTVQVNKAAVTQEPNAFVDPERLQRFRDLDARVSLDLRKLVRLCEELNLAYGNRAWFSVAFLTRTILNHIPPVFGQRNFAQVSSNATPKHFKVAAEALDQFARKVDDFHLHEMIGESLALPNGVQVDIRAHLDVVLAEVERALHRLSREETKL